MRCIQDSSQQNRQGGWGSSSCENQRRKAGKRQLYRDSGRSGRTDRISSRYEATLSGSQSPRHGRDQRKDTRGACINLGSARSPFFYVCVLENDGAWSFRYGTPAPEEAIMLTKHSVRKVRDRGMELPPNGTNHGNCRSGATNQWWLAVAMKMKTNEYPYVVENIVYS